VAPDSIGGSITVMAVMGLGRDYWKELDFATRTSKKVASPYRIDIIEIP
jgi:hypothetical protein